MCNLTVVTMGYVFSSKLLQSAESEQQEEKKPVKSTTGGKVVCRLCKGDHFTAKCPYRDTLGGLENAGGATCIVVLRRNLISHFLYGRHWGRTR